MSPVFSARVVLALAASLLTTTIFVHGSGDGMPTANLCNGSMTTFSDEYSFLPGQDVIITCSLPVIALFWTSPNFTGVSLSNAVTPSATRLDGAIVFNLTNVITTGSSPCGTATATIANIQESMQGLSLTCSDGNTETQTLTIDVIDPPAAVNFTAVQSFNEIIVLWENNSLPGDPCPITNYTITINGSTVVVAGNETQYTRPITDECGSTLEITMFATSAAGPGETTAKNLTIVAAPADLSLCAVMEFSETNVTFLNTTWEMPLEEAPEVDLLLEVTSPSLSPVPLDASTTMYPIEEVTLSGVFDVMAYFAGQRDSMCFSTFNQITIPSGFPEVSLSAPAIESEKARFILTINSTVFTVTSNNLELSGGDGECEIDASNSPSRNVTCKDLSEGASYNLTVDLSDDDNCLMVLTSFDTPSTTSLPTDRSTGTTTPSSTPDSTAAPAGDVVVRVLIPIVVVGLALLIIAGAMIGVILYIYVNKRKHKGDRGDGPIALVEKPAKDPKTGEVGTYDDALDGQEKKVHHQEAPTGDEYAVVEKPATRRAAPSTPQVEAMTYQDPSTIQRQEAPTGDLYALPNKEPKEPMPVYSEVNKQPDRVYADLALAKGGDSGVNRQQPTQEGFVTYSEILPPGIPPPRPPKPEESIPETSLYSEIQQPPPLPSPLPEQDSMVDVPEEESLYEKHQ